MVRVINAVIAFFQAILRPENYTLHNLLYFLLVVMCTQYIPIEGYTISFFKVAVMCVMPLVLLLHMRINYALVLGGMYIFWLFFTTTVINAASFRASTILYGCMYVITYVVFYTSIWNYQVLNIDDFLGFIRKFFFVMVGVLLAQQLCLIVGFRTMPILNLCQYYNRGIGANSLMIEPSMLGRLLALLYYAMLKCTEYRQDRMVSISEVFRGQMKWVTILYIWAVLTMGSGTAFVAVAILSLYFLRGRSLIWAIPIFIGAYMIMDRMDNSSFHRAQRTFVATTSGDVELVKQTDGSASLRVAPMLNTLHADFTQLDFWVGKGCDSTPDAWVRGTGNVGHIDDYGFISYILEMSLVFICAIRFFSLGTIFFFLGIGGIVGNIAYGWGGLMLFTCLRYFYVHRESLNDTKTMPSEE